MTLHQEQLAVSDAWTLVRRIQQALLASDPTTDKAWVILHNVLTHIETRFNSLLEAN